MARVLINLILLCALSAVALPESAAPAAPAAPVAPATPAAPAAEARADDAPAPEDEEPPEGYYAFVESPNATPPRVRPPPYRQVSAECAGAGDARPHVSANNLCGDLNRGVIPRNPMGQNPTGEPYPFELLRNHTLRFLSRALPVLRADDTLPRVQHIQQPRPQPLQHNRLEERVGRSVPDTDLGPDGRSDAGTDAVPSHALAAEHRALDDSPRETKFCEGGGVFCMLYRAINGGGSSSGVERREDPGPTPHGGAPHSPHTLPRYEGPPTPCPARVEYATPVFARNYQGVWRYVVQIPYEGYFTQTVEVTRCMQSRCHYLEGGCLSSPRWVSLLVAELHYPQEYQQPQYVQKRAGVSATSGAGSGPSGAGAGAGEGEGADKTPHCDGHDELGCYQVRLYYDWFLVPGSCKCWRPDYFARYVRRRHSTADL